MLATETTELNALRDNFELVPLVEGDLGENGVKHGDYVAFHNCLCGHHDCLRVYPHGDSADTFVCYSGSAEGGRKGTVIDWIVWRDGVDATEACKRFLEHFGGVDLKQRQREYMAPNDEPSSNAENPYISSGNKGQPLSRQGLAAYVWELNRDHGLDGVKFDTFSEQLTVKGGLPWDRTATVWRDIDEAFLEERFSEIHAFEDQAKLRSAIRIIGHERRFDSLQDYLLSLPTPDFSPDDPRSRLGRFFIQFLGTEDTPYTREVSRLFFLGAVARAFQPGCKFDYVPVLVGRQGLGKSVLCQRLAIRDEWFSDDLKGIGTREAAELLRGKWIVEVPKFEAMRSRNANAEVVKSFITRTSDTYRLPYGIVTVDHPRRCVFIGTTNDTAFLSDPSGNRRFLPIMCSGNGSRSIFDDSACVYIERTWAEAVALYKANPDAPLILPPEVQGEALRRQELATFEDPWVGLIGEFLEYHTGLVCALQLVHDAIGLSRDTRVARHDLNRIHSIMRTSFADTWLLFPNTASHKARFTEYGVQIAYQRHEN